MKKNILKTLIYADIFDYPLTAEELRKKLIVGVSQCDRTGQTPGFVPTELGTTLEDLVWRGRIEKQEKYYFLPGRKKIVELRRKREKYCRQKLEIAEKTAAIIKRLPLVKFVGVTGSVAAGNAQKEDDIDLLIITSPGWLWTARLLVTIIIGISGRRRWPNDKKTEDKICLNLFVDSSCLDIFDHNLFIAHEIIQLKSLVNKNEIYQRFLLANQWIKKYLPNAKKFNISNLENFNYNSGSRTIVEKLFYKIQLWWMKKRKTTEITKPGLIAFHPNDKNQEVMVKYKSRVSKL